MKKIMKWTLVIAVVSVLSWDVVCFAQASEAKAFLDNSIENALKEEGIDFPVIRVGSEHWKMRQATNKDFDGRFQPWSYMYSFSLQGAKKLGKRRLYVYPNGKLWEINQRDITNLLKMAPGTHVEMERTTDGYKYMLGQYYKKGTFGCLGVIDAPSGVKAFYVVEDCAAPSEMNREMNKFIKVKLPPAQEFPKREFNGIKQTNKEYALTKNGKWRKVKKGEKI